VNDNPPSTAEIAALTARLRALSNAGVAADPAERARFLADKDALIARISAAGLAHHEHSVVRNRTDQQVAEGRDPWADYRTYSPAEAVDELVARGVPASEAPGLLDRYLDETTAPLGRSTAEWDIDEDDLTVIAGAETLDRSREYDPSPDVQVETWLQAARNGAAEARNTGGAVDAALSDDLTAAAAAGVVELESRYDDLAKTALERDASRPAPAGLSRAEGGVLDAGPALTAENAAHELAADGRPLDEARQRFAATSTTSPRGSARPFTSGAWARPILPRCAPTRSNAPARPPPSSASRLKPCPPPRWSRPTRTGGRGEPRAPADPWR
jgi:hypothetical protein